MPQTGTVADNLRRAIWDRWGHAKSSDDAMDMLELVKMAGFGAEKAMMNDIVKKAFLVLAGNSLGPGINRMQCFKRLVEAFGKKAEGCGLLKEVKETARGLTSTGKMESGFTIVLDLPFAERKGFMVILKDWVRE